MSSTSYFPGIGSGSEPSVSGPVIEILRGACGFVNNGGDQDFALSMPNTVTIDYAGNFAANSYSIIIDAGIISHLRWNVDISAPAGMGISFTGLLIKIQINGVDIATDVIGDVFNAGTDLYNVSRTLDFSPHTLSDGDILKLEIDGHTSTAINTFLANFSMIYQHA